MSSASLSALLADLSDDQRAAVTDPHAALCVRAPAGSGKTRVLTRRVAYRAVLAESDDSIAQQRFMTVVTFTRKAASELQFRLRQVGVEAGRAGTFHALALAQLQKWYQNYDRTPPTVCRSSRNLLLDHLRKDRAAAQTLRSQFGVTDPTPSIDEYLRQISLAKASRQQPADPLHRWVMEIYQAQLQRARVIDFDDLIAEVTTRFSDDDAFARAQRYVWRSFFVDEAQDLTPAQIALLNAWRGENPELFIVGDPDQAIYGWAGTSPDTLRHPHLLFGPMPTIDLRQSFRSTASITSAAQRVLDQSTSAISQRETGHAPQVHRFDSESTEVDGVVRMIADKILKHNVAPRDIAILARTRAQLQPFINALNAARIATVYQTGEDALQAEDVNGVNVLTFHAAKGLEWPVVFVVGVEDGYVPLWRRDDDAQSAIHHHDEEQRLFYVALTRAQDELHCSWAASRKLGARLSSRQPSPWLARVAGTATPTHAPVAIDLRDGEIPPSERHRLLTAWRAQRARTTGLPASAILSDVSLEEIVAVNPQTIQDLAKVASLNPLRRHQLGRAIISTLNQAKSGKNFRLPLPNTVRNGLR